MRSGELSRKSSIFSAKTHINGFNVFHIENMLEGLNWLGGVEFIPLVLRLDTWLDILDSKSKSG